MKAKAAENKRTVVARASLFHATVPLNMDMRVYKILHAQGKRQESNWDQLQGF